MTLFAVSLALAGCGLARPSSTHAAGTEVRAIDVGGVDREFRVHIPRKRARESDLVVVIHGGFGSAEQAEAAYGWNEVAESEGLIVAYPSGKGVAWNAGTCCGRAAHNDVDDVGFVAAMVAELQEEYGVSPDRTFATGMSNGAMMTYRLACETDLFAAIAPVAGTIVTGCADPSPTSVLHIHGRDDERVRYDGEVGSGATRVDGLAVEEDVALWRAVDACPEPQVTAKPPLTTTTANCPEGRTVSLIAIDGAGHQWPGASTNGLSGPDPASTALDATAVIWKFFDGWKG
ncbi:alpha/beta hydrolase family esterase [Paractinoplanes brasiliensis]|uniref:alpha/beta hydrolase family esterase n=1 Tax=Paractinoplanes brasiliensis TaxID=52695 RepID=UPI0014152AC0|nr:PHB depolymerase family esterase [Actinoplanes brasiliensis]